MVNVFHVSSSHSMNVCAFKMLLQKAPEQSNKDVFE